jgi:hypothetical protein
MKIVSIDEMIQCANREVAIRQSVYAHRVMSGKMRQAAADEELARMRAIHRTLVGIERDMPSFTESGEPPEKQ